jgi:hypothetical protein
LSSELQIFSLSSPTLFYGAHGDFCRFQTEGQLKEFKKRRAFGAAVCSAGLVKGNRKNVEPCFLQAPLRQSLSAHPLPSGSIRHDRVPHPRASPHGGDVTLKKRFYRFIYHSNHNSLIKK